MYSRIAGGILLIVGTSIGGGMLALPVANAAVGFWTSSLLLIACWVIMTLGAFYILEASLYLPPGKHLVSMAHATLGKPGLAATWLCYLFLLYTLLSAYISGGADMTGALLNQAGLSVAPWQSSLLFTLLFGSVVYGGIHQVDLLNRGLMFGKLAIFFILVLFIAPWVHADNLHYGEWRAIRASLMILITSFGFAIIVPNLREYFNHQTGTLKWVILVGSLIPLVCYLVWDMVILGSLDTAQGSSLATLMHNEHTTSALATRLSATVHNAFISNLLDFFSSICMLTAFLGVALCLMAFLGDGLAMRQQGKEGFLLFLLTFMPPLFLVIFYPGAYMGALAYAGFLCVVLLLLLPALMCFFGRRHYQPPFVVPGGKAMQGLVMGCSIVLLAIAVWPE